MAQRKKRRYELKSNVSLEELRDEAAIKVDFKAFDVTEQRNWISFALNESKDGDITRIRPNFMQDHHLVCHWNEQDHKYDDCYLVPVG